MSNEYSTAIKLGATAPKNNNVEIFKKADVISAHSKHELAISNAVSAITTLALLHTNIIHIEFEYCAWLKSFSVKVFDVDTDYMRAHPRKFGCGVQLDQANSLDYLHDLEDKLISLIADAKDKAMVMVKVKV